MIRSREIAGWILVAAGLGIFGLTFYTLIAYTMIVQSGPMVAVGFIVFRGGIHLLKVALAAKICQPMRDETPKRVGNAMVRPKR